MLLFGGRAVLERAGLLAEVRARWPGALLLGCSTAGEILGTEVTDDTLAVTAIGFERTRVAGTSVAIASAEESCAAGVSLARALDPRGLTHAFVLSDGRSINGSELVKGLTSALPPRVEVTGGLAGDGTRFERTFVIFDDPALSSGAVPVASDGRVAIVGFYGEHLRVGCASLGGWDPFGPERLVTRAERNVLYELDGRSALELYRRYLGDHAAGLPAAGLLFPLSVRSAGGVGVVRTILSIDEATQSLVFAGDVPEGSYARLMKANVDRLIDGAVGAAQTCRRSATSERPDVAVLISCIGRRMVLKQRTEEEVEGVREILGMGTALTGFYSYGEISPFSPTARCELHNQTMTITTFTELG